MASRAQQQQRAARLGARQHLEHDTKMNTDSPSGKAARATVILLGRRCLLVVHLRRGYVSKSVEACPILACNATDRTPRATREYEEIGRDILPGEEAVPADSRAGHKAAVHKAAVHKAAVHNPAVGRTAGSGRSTRLEAAEEVGSSCRSVSSVRKPRFQPHQRSPYPC
jgi:hypothetical protein